MKRMSLLAVILAGCVSQGEHEAVKAERDMLAIRVAELETKLKGAEGTASAGKAKADRFSAEKERRAAKAAEARATLGVADGQSLTATLHTSLGEIPCALWVDVAPVTVTNFVQLAEGTKAWTDPATGAKRTDPLYNGTVFHRVIEGFMIQGGDPLGNGRGGPGYRFEDEVFPDVRFDQKGLLAMANSGPATNGSQFFITDSTPAHLNGKHTIFGKCEMDVVTKIIAQPKHPEPRGAPSQPIEPVKIERIAVTRG